MSGNSKINHPLCDECTDTLMDMMEGELQQAEADYTDYSNYLKECVLYFDCRAIINNLYYFRLSTEEPEDMDTLTKELEEVSKNIYFFLLFENSLV